MRCSVPRLSLVMEAIYCDFPLFLVMRSPRRLDLQANVNLAYVLVDIDCLSDRHIGANCSGQQPQRFSNSTLLIVIISY